MALLKKMGLFLFAAACFITTPACVNDAGDADVALEEHDDSDSDTTEALGHSCRGGYHWRDGQCKSCPRFEENTDLHDELRRRSLLQEDDLAHPKVCDRAIDHAQDVHRPNAPSRDKPSYEFLRTVTMDLLNSLWISGLKGEIVKIGNGGKKLNIVTGHDDPVGRWNGPTTSNGQISDSLRRAGFGNETMKVQWVLELKDDDWVVTHVHPGPKP
jgi:hypothetical protein